MFGIEAQHIVMVGVGLFLWAIVVVRQKWIFKTLERILDLLERKNKESASEHDEQT